MTAEKKSTSSSESSKKDTSIDESESHVIPVRHKPTVIQPLSDSKDLKPPELSSVPLEEKIAADAAAEDSSHGDIDSKDKEPINQLDEIDKLVAQATEERTDDNSSEVSSETETDEPSGDESVKVSLQSKDPEESSADQADNSETEEGIKDEAGEKRIQPSAEFAAETHAPSTEKQGQESTSSDSIQEAPIATDSALGSELGADDKSALANPLDEADEQEKAFPPIPEEYNIGQLLKPKKSVSVAFVVVLGIVAGGGIGAGYIFFLA